MHARGVAAKWQSRRKISLGPVRRACPASGATWNVQVVRGKMTSRCLWHACRALALGLLLMLIGAGMATIGYYAEHISPHTETRNISTVRVKPDSKGIHLHNLSYAGPIVMGCGAPGMSSSNVGSQTRWDNQLGVFRTSPLGDNPAQSRTAQTAALVHFSRFIGSVNYSPKDRRFSRSGSVPNLTSCNRSPTIPKQNSISPTAQRIRQHHRTSKKDRIARGIRSMHRNNLNKSIDEGGVYFTSAKPSIDSQNSMGEFSGNKRERNKRSDTGKRHILARQKQIDNSSEVHNNVVSKTNFSDNRSNSTNSGISKIFRKGGKSSSVSRTPSVDSRGVQTDEILEKAIITSPPYRKAGTLIAQTSTPSVEGKFKSQLSVCSEPANIPVYQLSIDQTLAEEVVPKVPQSPNVVNKVQISTTLSVETTTTTSDEQSVQIKRPTTLGILDCNRVDPVVVASTSNECTTTTTTATTSVQIENPAEKPSSSVRQIPKTLFRSNSSSLHKRESTFVPAATTSAANKFKLSSELDHIFVISTSRSNNDGTFASVSAAGDDENYDSIEVIDERRMKNMAKSDRARLYKSNTFICEEYYTNEQLACVMDTTTTIIEPAKETIIEEKRE
ncbi:uncharacterized protein LOC129573125 isoform X2 [Sitodiplosis mosellana]|uniref:uncharacterized protein LOC129573125 isoform X2 n=1 Tax=Sitodiplosis mosellana TaxID=263140 RepID=UPI002444D1D0|nr:uncharacterized protein LOC129573125 isoform X2 [Sitodiplosis mosellana]XP_055309369.1 uncharacterized protein LOC129573125 isoform X2 [Sitodiplosis mosellana]